MSTISNEITTLLEKVNRPGMSDLIEWLRSTDYFTAPASTKHHGAYVGGLAGHSLNVFDCLCVLNAELADNVQKVSEDSLIIVGLLHDLCKVNYYVENDELATAAQVNYMGDLMGKTDFEPIPKEHQTKSHVSKVIEYLKNGGNHFPIFEPAYKVKDQFPMGHGEKSLSIIQRFMDLTDAEALAIRWHLGYCDPGAHGFYPSGVALQQSIKDYPLVPMTISADFLSVWIIENVPK